MSLAIFFGSIGTIADTSELQRQSFNQAFARHHLDWHWPREAYQTLLAKSGGRQRIAEYAEAAGLTVDAEAIHQTKSEIFQTALQSGMLEPRPGVKETIQQARQSGIKLALVTTTAQQNVSSLLGALGQHIRSSDFDLILDRSCVQHSKPDPEAYCLTLKQLNQSPDRCVAIEDNLAGVESAKAAGLACVAFPGENTLSQSFDLADYRVDRLDFDHLLDFNNLKNTHLNNVSANIPSSVCR